jgi:hypothetical protein
LKREESDFMEYEQVPEWISNPNLKQCKLMALDFLLMKEDDKEFFDIITMSIDVSKLIGEVTLGMASILTSIMTLHPEIKESMMVARNLLLEELPLNEV